MWSRLAAARLRGVLDSLARFYTRKSGDYTFSLVLPTLFWISAVRLPLAWAAVFDNDTLSTCCALLSLSAMFLYPSLVLSNFDSFKMYTVSVSASRAARDAEVASLRADAAANSGRLSSLRLARSLPALVGLDDPLAVAAACETSARAGREETIPPGAVLVAACVLRESPRVVADGNGGGLPAVVWEVPAGQGEGSGTVDDETALPIARLWSALVNAAGAAAAAVVPPPVRSAAAGEAAAAARCARNDAESSHDDFFAQFSSPLTAAALAAQGVMAAALAVAYCARFDVGGAGDSTSWWLLPLLTGYSLLCFAPGRWMGVKRGGGARGRGRGGVFAWLRRGTPAGRDRLVAGGAARTGGGGFRRAAAAGGAQARPMVGRRVRWR